MISIQILENWKKNGTKLIEFLKLFDYNLKNSYDCTRETVNSQSAIDLFFANHNCKFYVEKTKISIHYSIFLELAIATKNNVPACPKLIKQLHKLKDENLCLDINFWLYKKFQENRSFIKSLELNDVFTVIQELILKAKETYIPKKTIFFRSGCKKNWVTNKIKNLSQKKHILWNKYLKSKLEEDKVKYKVVSNRLKALRRLTKTEHFEKKVSSKHSSRTLFHLAKDIRNDQNENKSILLSCDQLNYFFVNIGNQLANKEVFQGYLRHVKTVTNTLFLQKTNNSEVYKIINSLPNKSLEDCYGLSSLILKDVNLVVCNLLADQFNRCIDENDFTEVLKLAKVLQFHKSGDWNDAGNFRPISLLPIISKVFEKFLFKRIENFLNVNRVLSPNQFGFTSKRNTIDAVSEVVEFLRTNRNLKTSSSCTFIDLT